jgi:hypothetical protein
MLISLRHLQVEAGVSFDLLRFPSTEIPYLTNCWMVTLRRFCAEFGISIKFQSDRIPVLARSHDSCLMDSALLLGFTRQELIDVNLVRIFLQVTTMSDIASADGQCILLAIIWWQGQHISNRHSNMSFARQLQPTTYQQGLWRRLLRSYLVPSSKASHLRLLTPLGSWFCPSNMTWGAMTWDDALYRRDPTNRSGKRQFSVHLNHHLAHPNGTSTNCAFYNAKPGWYTATIPRLAAPTDITGDQIFIATSSTVSFPSIPSPVWTFSDWKKQLPPAEQRLLASVSFADCDAEQALVQYLQVECTLFIGTDGGKRLKMPRSCGSYVLLVKKNLC